MKSPILLKHLILGSFLLLSLLSSCKKDKEDAIEKLPCTITEDKVLEDKSDGIDYLATCEVLVSKGTLTVKPGVTIAFETNAGITVREQGALIAVGTVSKPILFTGKSKARGAWKGIFFQSNSVLNKMDYATIEYAGGSIQTDMDEETALGIGTTDININEPSRGLITNTTVKESNGYGLSIDYTTTITGFANNKFINNDMAGVRLPLGYLGFLDAGSDYLTGNGGAYIAVRIGDDDDFVKTNQTWKLLNAPYYVDKGTQNVYAGEIHADVTIEAGVTMIFNTSTGLVVGNGSNGSLKAIGTQSKPIIFKGYNNGNGSWIGLSFNTASVNNILEYCTVEGGGASNPPYNDPNEKGNIVLGSWYSATAKLNIKNSTLKNSGCWGMFIDTNTSLTLGAGVVYQNNTCGDKNK